MDSSVTAWVVEIKFIASRGCPLTGSHLKSMSGTIVLRPVFTYKMYLCTCNKIVILKVVLRYG